MRIAIDMEGAQSSGSWNRGIGRYTMAIAKAICRNPELHEVLLVLNGAFSKSIARIKAEFTGLIPSENIHVWHSPTPTCYATNTNIWRRRCAELMRDEFLASLKPEIVLISSLMEGYVDDAAASISSCRSEYIVAVILYDLIPLIHEERYLTDPKVRRWYLDKVSQLRQANAWLAISEATRQDGIQHLKLPAEHCVNISTDADSHFNAHVLPASVATDIRAKYGLSRSFVMYTGGIDYRKNIEGLIRAYSLLGKEIRDRHQLAIVCSIAREPRDALLSLAREHGLEEQELILTGFVPDQDLVSLYSLCTLFVFPSFYEGFGLPLLEAMRCGAAVIAANTSSLVEVVGWSEALFDPSSDQSIAELISRGLTDEKFQQQLKNHATSQARKFSWETSAQRALDLMTRRLKELRPQRIETKKGKELPRLAYLSPLPPDRSGIADYSAELLPHLIKHYRVEVVRTSEDVSDHWIASTIPIRSVAWFLENATQFERVIYHFGNSVFHGHMFELIEKIPGVLVLHDFFLNDLLRAMDANHQQSGLLARHLYESHGYKALRQSEEPTAKSDTSVEFPCSGQPISSSLGVIFHSQYAASLAAQWYGLKPAFYAIAPLARSSELMPDRGKSRARLAIKEEDFVVCSFGIVDPRKLHHHLVDAWLESDLAKDPQCQLLLIGEYPINDYGNKLKRLIGEHPYGGTIRIVGWVGADDYQSYLAAADVGVQLRTSARGETSAAVLDCMNHGLATVVNANGSMAELNEACVLKLPDMFSQEQLVSALERLWRDQELRSNISRNAQQEVRLRHNPQVCSESYSEAIERFYSSAPAMAYSLPNMIGTIRDGSPLASDFIALAQCIEDSYPLPCKQHQVLIDITHFLGTEHGSTRHSLLVNALSNCLSGCPRGWRVEPVYTIDESPYRYARRFTGELLDLSQVPLDDTSVRCKAGDILVQPGSNAPPDNMQATAERLLVGQGARVVFIPLEDLGHHNLRDLLQDQI